MYQRRHPNTPVNRRGLVLLVVLALLTLFMIVGLTFVYYADNELEASRLADSSANVSQPDLDPETAGFFALGQILYGTQSGAPSTSIGLVPGYANDSDGLYSMLRGHELARTIYGFRDDPGADNSWAFTGAGRLHTPQSFLTTAGVPGMGPLGNDDFYLVNYMGWSLANPGQPPGPGNPFLPFRDPERNGTRPGPQSPYTAGNQYIGTANPPYTYPDLNNMLLAAVDPSGNVLAISGHREALFGRLDDPNNANWTNPEGRYLILRPRPADNPPTVVGGVTKPGFPMPEDRWGDVKNLIGAPGGNDSIWIDIGAPVQTLPDGRKYKMLIAPLILDMDGRVNVNVHGNILGGTAPNQTHLSNQGLGKWEINLSKVLNADNAANPAEWRKVFLGNPQGPLGRYGIDSLPSSGGQSPAFRSSPYYSRLDFNARNEPPSAGQPSSPLQVPIYGNPVPANSPALSLFPSLLAAGGYGDGSAPERTDHPLLYNFFRPSGDDRAFPASSMEAILRFNDTNSPALTSDLFRLLPINLANPQVRKFITSHSADIDRPGILPYIWDPADQANAGTKYIWQSLPNGTYPRGNPITFPPLANRGATPANSEFDPATWRAISAALGRIDLNSINNFSEYPAPDANGFIDMTVMANATKFNAAQGQRQQMAKRIYTALRAATGAIADPPGPIANPEPADFQALRWLAQLSVNIVDYIDYDDISTPFNWYTDPTNNKTYWVFGTELPRVVLNEAYAEISNDPADAAAPPAKPFRVKFWVELYNPLSKSTATAISTTPPDDGTARLQVAAGANNKAYAVYQVVVTGAPNTNLTKPDNVLGDPDPGAANANLKLVVSDYTPVALPVNTLGPTQRNLIHPLATSSYGGPDQGNSGFYVLGPPEDFPHDAGATGVPTASMRLSDQNLSNATNANWVTSAYATPTVTAFESSMVYTLPNTTANIDGLTHSVLLRRLACPHLPPQLDPTKANYNPYVTVDYLDAVPINDAVQFLPGGANAMVVATATRTSVGRREPFAAALPQIVAQAPSPALTLQPQHTMFRHNAREAAPANNNPDPNLAGGQTLQIPFHWLTHLNRQLVSPGELLQVSGYKPHELTHQFVTGALPGVPYQHLAPWFDQQARIYRAFEIFETGDRAAGMSVGGRWPGKININTLWPQPDPNNPGGTMISPVFRALCDAQTSNNFTPAQVDAIYTSLLTRRSPNLLMNPPSLSLNDRPFLGMAPGQSAVGDPQYPQPIGIENTLFASVPGNGIATDQRMFGVNDPNVTYAQTHPYQQNALLTKIFSNVTTRSNVFAVYITVGFFEVNDDSVRPVKLGAELNRSENRHVRHRVFALVDRTNLTAYATTTGQQGVMLNQTPPNPSQTPPAPQPVTVTLAAVSGVDPRTGRQWQIQPGSVLVFDPNDPNGNEETVLVTAVAPGTITANFTKSHLPGPVISRGNPGPWQRYDARQDNLVVPYFSVID